MQVFISWSGARSKAVAQALRSYIGRIIQAARPWMSDRDIDSGQRWSKEIADKLDASSFGICVVTPENQGSEWLNFEAGAIAKAKEEGRLVPLLVELKLSDLQGPMSQFQACELTEEGLRRLFVGINAALEKSALSDVDLDEVFSAFAEQMMSTFSTTLRDTPVETPKEGREDREVLDEILIMVRDLHRAPRKTMQIRNTSVPLKELMMKHASDAEGDYVTSLVKDATAHITATDPLIDRLKATLAAGEQPKAEDMEELFSKLGVAAAANAAATAALQRMVHEAEHRAAETKDAES